MPVNTSLRGLLFRPKQSLFVLLVFFINTIGPLPQAQADDFVLPKPGVRVSLSPEFNPPILKGIKVHPDNPFRFDFILDQGDLYRGHVPREAGYVSPQEQLKQQATKLIKYFLASLTIPAKDLWVNLSPYEKNRIIPRSFGLTAMGRDLLAEDYMLKQITASLIYPEDEIGKKFWKRIYEEAAKKFGTTNIPVNTFNKVWIVPEKAMVYENAKAGTAYVVESRLKVMLEEDYVSLQKHSLASPLATPNDIHSIGANIVREIIIPELTKEVNENKNFSQLRQVYNSLILATWYKKKIKDSILAQVYADKNKIQGLVIPAKAGIQDKNDVEFIYQRYLQAFKKGAYNYIKEETDSITQKNIPRKYFSGGTEFINLAMATVNNIGKNEEENPNLVDLTVNVGMPVNAGLDHAMLILGPRTTGEEIKEALRPIVRQTGRRNEIAREILSLVRSKGAELNWSDFRSIVKRHKLGERELKAAFKLPSEPQTRERKISRRALITGSASLLLASGAAYLVKKFGSKQSSAGPRVSGIAKKTIVWDGLPSDQKAIVINMTWHPNPFIKIQLGNVLLDASKMETLSRNEGLRQFQAGQIKMMLSAEKQGIDSYRQVIKAVEEQIKEHPEIAAFGLEGKVFEGEKHRDANELRGLQEEMDRIRASLTMIFEGNKSVDLEKVIDDITLMVLTYQQYLAVKDKKIAGMPYIGLEDQTLFDQQMRNLNDDSRIMASLKSMVAQGILSDDDFEFLKRSSELPEFDKPILDRINDIKQRMGVPYEQLLDDYVKNHDENYALVDKRTKVMANHIRSYGKNMIVAVGETHYQGLVDTLRIIEGISVEKNADRAMMGEIGEIGDSAQLTSPNRAMKTLELAYPVINAPIFRAYGIQLSELMESLKQDIAKKGYSDKVEFNYPKGIIFNSSIKGKYSYIVNKDEWKSSFNGRVMELIDNSFEGRNGHDGANRVVVNIKIEKNQLVVEIEDDGPGIPEEIMSSLNERIAREESITTKSSERKDGINGFGLISTARTFIGRMSAKVGIENRPVEKKFELGGKTGTTIRITVPITKISIRLSADRAMVATNFTGRIKGLFESALSTVDQIEAIEVPSEKSLVPQDIRNARSDLNSMYEAFIRGDAGDFGYQITMLKNALAQLPAQINSMEDLGIWGFHNEDRQQLGHLLRNLVSQMTQLQFSAVSPTGEWEGEVGWTMAAQALDKAMAHDPQALAEMIGRYGYDLQKARSLAEEMRQPGGHFERDAEGWDVFISSQGHALVRISPLGSKRFFDDKDQWLMTVDPFGHIMESFQYDKEGNVAHVEGLLPSGQGFQMEYDKHLRNTVVKRKNSESYHFFLGIETDPNSLFNTPDLIPTAFGAEQIPPEARGVGVIVLNLLSRLLKDKNLRRQSGYKKLKYVGAYPLPYVFHSLNEVGNHNRNGSYENFYSSPSTFEWEPRPLERIFNESTGVYLHIKDGKIVRAVRRLGDHEKHYFPGSSLDRIEQTSEHQFVLQDEVNGSHKTTMVIDELGNRVDSAMTATGQTTKKVHREGGIDLTPANMNLQTKMDSRLRGNDNGNRGNDKGGIGNSSEGIRFHLDPAMLQQLQNAPGLVPVIINIQPMKDLMAFLDSR